MAAGISATEEAVPDAHANAQKQQVTQTDETSCAGPAADGLTDPAAENNIEPADMTANDPAILSRSGSAAKGNLGPANGQPDAALLFNATEATAVSEEDKVAACERQLQEKIARVKQLFSGFQLPEVEVFRSAPEHYRLRCVLGTFNPKTRAVHLATCLIGATAELRLTSGRSC